MDPKERAAWGYGPARGDAARGRRDRRENRGDARTAGSAADPRRKRAGTNNRCDLHRRATDRLALNRFGVQEAFLGEPSAHHAPPN